MNDVVYAHADFGNPITAAALSSFVCTYCNYFVHLITSLTTMYANYTVKPTTHWFPSDILEQILDHISFDVLHEAIMSWKWRIAGTIKPTRHIIWWMRHSTCLALSFINACPHWVKESVIGACSWLIDCCSKRHIGTRWMIMIRRDQPWVSYK